MSDEQIQRVNTGLINTVDDVTPGGGLTYGPSGGLLAAGQLGAKIGLRTTGVDLFYDASVSTVRPGEFQYVQVATGATGPSGATGVTMYWKTGAAVGSYLVAGSGQGTVKAGVALNPNWTPGRYGYIQTSTDIVAEGGQGPAGPTG